MLIIDCETVAVTGLEIEPVTAPANYKDEAKIAAYIAEAEQAQRDKAALYPWTCRIIAIGWCYEGSEAVTVRTGNADAMERAMLQEFWYDAKGQNLVTFNGLEFDLPVLMARSRLLGVDAPVLNIDRYRSPHPDLLKLLRFNGAIPGRSLRWFAKRFGLNTDDAFSGAHVAGLVEAGNWDAIEKHVESDVTLTRQLAERLGVIKARSVTV